MRALYRQGRHTDALAVFQAWRRHLGEELGLEPSPKLQAIERDILCHTFGAGAEPRPAPRRTPPPVPVSSFVGREDDLTFLTTLVKEQRLVTLIGPGGVGKTRLGLEVAAAAAGRYDDGVCFCDLATIRRGAEVTRAVASAVGLEERGTRRLEDQVADHLAPQRLLIFLDSCEQLLDGAAALTEHLIQHTHHVDVLATSRERLAVDGEHLWAVTPLPAAGADAPAVRLFVDRALAVAPEFGPSPDDLAAISDICSRLDGLPLAIELAAARLRGLTVDELATRLEQRFQWLTDGRRTSPRHRSLRAVVDWSHDQLELAEQRVFRRLVAFARSFDLEAARSVAAGDGIDQDEVGPVVLRLVDRSLISERPTAQGSRYSLLDTVRAYGLEQLEAAGEASGARDRHAQWAVDFAEQAEAGLAGPDEAVWATAVLDRWDELRAAHGWLVGRDDDRSLRLVAALHFFALWRTQSEVFRWAEVAAAVTSPSPWLPAALATAGTGAWLRGDLAAAAAKGRAGVDLARQGQPEWARRPLEVLGDVALLLGDLPRAFECYRDASERALAAGDLVQAVWDRSGAALALTYGGDLSEAGRLAAETQEIAVAGGSPSALAYAHFTLGEVDASADRVREAEDHLHQAIALAEDVASRYIVGLARNTLASVAGRHLDVQTALRHYESVIVEWQDSGSWTAQWVTLRTLVDLLAKMGATSEAAVIYGAVTSARSGAPPYGADEARLQRVAERLHSSLGDAPFERCLRQGEALRDDEVIAAALDAVRRVSQTGPTNP